MRRLANDGGAVGRNGRQRHDGNDDYPGHDLGLIVPKLVIDHCANRPNRRQNSLERPAMATHAENSDAFDDTRRPCCFPNLAGRKFREGKPMSVAARPEVRS